MKNLKVFIILLLASPVVAIVGPPAGNPVLNSSLPQNATMNIASGTVRGQATVGTLQGASLATCGDALHGLGWAAGHFTCQNIPGLGGVNASSLAVSSGSETDFVLVSTPTGNVIVDSNTLLATPVGADGVFIAVNPDKVTTQGNVISLADLSASTSSLAASIANLVSSTDSIQGVLTAIKTSTGSLQVQVDNLNSSTSTLITASSASVTYGQINRAQEWTSTQTLDTAVLKNLIMSTSYYVYGDSGTITPDAKLGANISITLTSSATINIPVNAQDFQVFRYRFLQDAAGSRDIYLGTDFTFGLDISTWTYSAANGKTSYLGCVYRASAGKCDVVTGSIGGY